MKSNRAHAWRQICFKKMAQAEIRGHDKKKGEREKEEVLVERDKVQMPVVSLHDIFYLMCPAKKKKKRRRKDKSRLAAEFK